VTYAEEYSMNVNRIQYKLQTLIAVVQELLETI
jgi:hypothetical protein